MTGTTTCSLPQKSINYLQDLIQVNIDSRDGFREAAEYLKPKSGGFLYNVFYKLAGDRAAQASELQALVACNAETPTNAGSMSAAAHRTWIGLREAFGGGEQALLDEAERGEDHIKAAYEKAINDLGACSCTDTLRKHLSSVRASHDQIRNLRDRCARGEACSV